MLLKVVTSAVWIYMIANLYTAIASEDCGDSHISLDLKGRCTNSSCFGECRDENTCCLEKCFAGDRPSIQELEGCAADSDVEGTCSNFANQTQCIADNLNKTFAACWKHTIYYISNHPVVSKISGFNPINCPCESGNIKIDGECYYPQCLNSSYCRLDKDSVRETPVCCLDVAILPIESDCGNHERLDKSINKHIYVSSLSECQNECQEGDCKMPDPNRFPACCKHRIVKQKDDGSLHGSVIAVIIILIVVLLVAGAFGGYYVYRTRKKDTSRKIESNTSSIEMTGVDEMMEIKSKTNGFLASPDEDTYLPDEFDHVSTPELTGSEQTGVEILRARDEKYSFDNHSYIIDSDNLDDGGSRRTGSLEISTIQDSHGGSRRTGSLEISTIQDSHGGTHHHGNN